MPRGPARGCGQQLSLTIWQCVDASGYYAYAHSDNSVEETRTTLTASNQAYDPATGLNSGATYSPVPCACQLLEP